MQIITEDEMPLLKYFRSLRAKNRRCAAMKTHENSISTIRNGSDSPREELLAAQCFYADQETTRNLGRRGKLKKHITGIFII
jgi:hypothetical protein